MGMLVLMVDFSSFHSKYRTGNGQSVEHRTHDPGAKGETLMVVIVSKIRSRSTGGYAKHLCTGLR